LTNALVRGEHTAEFASAPRLSLAEFQRRFENWISAGGRRRRVFGLDLAAQIRLDPVAVEVVGSRARTIVAAECRSLQSP
jgi:hypothetical protein